MVVVSTEDDGHGAADRLSELGQRGHRLDESKPGAGLGLAIASEIVRLNNGRIEFEKAATVVLGRLAFTFPAASNMGE